MEGEAETVTPTDLVGVDADGWTLAVASPGLETPAADEPVGLENAAVVVFTRPA
jgi:hypothetical protein